MYQSQIKIFLWICVLGLAVDGYVGTHAWAVGSHGITYMALGSALIICVFAFWIGHIEPRTEYPKPFNESTEYIVGVAARVPIRKDRVTGAALYAFTLWLPAPAYFSHLCKELWKREQVAAHECEMGFWTNRGQFVNCIQAREIAFIQGQLGWVSYSFSDQKPLDPDELW